MSCGLIGPLIGSLRQIAPPPPHGLVDPFDGVPPPHSFRSWTPSSGVSSPSGSGHGPLQEAPPPPLDPVMEPVRRVPPLPPDQVIDPFDGVPPPPSIRSSTPSDGSPHPPPTRSLTPSGGSPHPPRPSHGPPDEGLPLPLDPVMDRPARVPPSPSTRSWGFARITLRTPDFSGTRTFFRAGVIFQTISTTRGTYECSTLLGWRAASNQPRVEECQ